MSNKAVNMYNTEKPHQALNKLNPVLFESLINRRKKEANTEMITFTNNSLTNNLKVVITI